MRYGAEEWLVQYRVNVTTQRSSAGVEQAVRQRSYIAGGRTACCYRYPQHGCVSEQVIPDGGDGAVAEGWWVVQNSFQRVMFATIARRARDTHTRDKM